MYTQTHGRVRNILEIKRTDRKKEKKRNDENNPKVGIYIYIY